MIERGWACFGGSPTSQDVCYLLPKAYVVNMTLDTANSIATIVFNETVVLDPNWVQSDMQVYVNGPKSPYAMTWILENIPALQKQGQQTWQISLSITDQIFKDLQQVSPYSLIKM